MKHNQKQPAVKCPYCGRTAVLRAASYVYKEKAVAQQLYVCSGYPKCDSYVSVHSGSLRPRGTLANRDLRNKRIHTHRIFDSIWQQGIMSRNNTYRWMQDTFGLSSKQAHIGQLSEYRCECLIAECKKVLRNNKIAC